MISFGAAAAVGLGKENRMALAAQKAQYMAQQYGRTVDKSRWSAMSPIHIAPTEKQAETKFASGYGNISTTFGRFCP